LLSRSITPGESGEHYSAGVAMRGLIARNVAPSTVVPCADDESTRTLPTCVDKACAPAKAEARRRDLPHPCE